jgi:hypothetical protein
MSKKMASILLIYGITLAALSLFIQQLAPPFAKVTLLAGIAGGALSVLWGILALAGHKGRAWASITMIAVTVVMLSQVVQAWLASTDATSTSLAGRLVLTLMLLMTFGLLLYVVHGERPPEFYDPGAAHREKPSSHAERTQSSNVGPRQ